MQINKSTNMLSSAPRQEDGPEALVCSSSLLLCLLLTILLIILRTVIIVIVIVTVIVIAIAIVIVVVIIVPRQEGGPEAQVQGPHPDRLGLQQTQASGGGKSSIRNMIIDRKTHCHAYMYMLTCICLHEY